MEDWRARVVDTLFILVFIRLAATLVNALFRHVGYM